MTAQIPDSLTIEGRKWVIEECDGGCSYSIKRKCLIDISSFFAGLNFRQAIIASPYTVGDGPGCP